MHLSVPGQMSGVVGPCPNCQVLIQAPYTVPQPPAQEPEWHPLAPPDQDTRTDRPAYPQEFHISPYSEDPSYFSDVREAPRGHRAPVAAEPRRVPIRSEPIRDATRKRSDPSGEIHLASDSSSTRNQRSQGGRIIRLLAPIVLLCFVLGTFYGVKKILVMAGDSDRQTTSTTRPGDSTVEIILPEDTGDSFEKLTEKSPGTISVGDPDMPAIGGESSSTSRTATDSGLEALLVLEGFLKMNTLEKRLPHIESALDEAQLADSIFSGPLPNAEKIEVDIRETNQVKNIVDHYYLVDFEDGGGQGGVDQQTMLVRVRGESPPKVVVDPFLDLFGGRFKRFASSPGSKPEKFQVIVSAGPVCFADIPGAKGKFPLKIMSRERTKEIARAYCGRQSKIGRMLDDENSGISFGQAKACTVFMRWNLVEDPTRPFIEALDITSLDWNPPH